MGVQKAGTSTLHDILKQHPDLRLPEYKETHFFRDDDKFEKGLDHYFDYYFSKQKQAITGEIDPEYSYFPGCAERIHKAFGDIKVIFILRNPLERAYSHYLMSQRRGIETLSFEEALHQESNRLDTFYNRIHFSYRDRGNYHDQVMRYENIFGPSNVKVFLFEEFIRNKVETVNSITDFIGLKPYKFNYDIQSNPASEPKSKLIRDFIYKDSTLKKAVGKVIPSKKMKDKIMLNLNKANLKEATKIPLEQKERKSIYNIFFREQVEQIETKLGKNLPNWKYNL